MNTLQKTKVVIAENKIANQIEMSIKDEDQTLGNALVMDLQTRSDVEFAGYKVPHPLQNILKVKVSAASTEHSPVEIVKESLRDLKRECDTLYTSISFYKDG